MGFALLQFPDFFLDRAGRDQPVGVHGLGLANAVRAIDGLRFDGGVPPRIVQHHVAGGGEIEAGAGGAEAEQEHRGVRIALEVADDFLPVLGLAGENVRVDVMRFGIPSPATRASARIG